jgi:uncharacterized cupredoxin-like copper-binding protein
MKHKRAIDLFLPAVVAFSFAWMAGFTGQPAWGAEVDYVEDAVQIVKSTDWSKMKTVTVKMEEYSFSPDTLRFKRDAPYKLEIKNVGSRKHYFAATAFFKAVASRKVQSNADGEIKAPYFTALEVFPGRQLDFYFVPVKKGSYYLLCTIRGHEEKGMHGRMIIE